MNPIPLILLRTTCSNYMPYIDIQMNTSQQSKCNQCLKIFTLEAKPRKMPTCAHNICQSCFSEIKASTQKTVECQFCDSISNQCNDESFSINQQVIQDISQHSLGSLPNQSLKQVKEEIQKKDDCLIEDDNQFLLKGDNLFVDVVGRLKDKIRKIGYCEEHEKNLEIICLSDMQSICPHCAIFGNHKNHEFKTLKEFYKDFEETTQQLQFIKKQKSEINKKLQSNQSQSDIFNRLHCCHQELKDKITKEFQSLYQTINKIQQKAQDDLSQIFVTVEKDAAKLLAKDPKIQQRFLSWQQTCEDALRKMLEEEGNLDEKIELLYGELADIKEGQKIIDNLTRNYEIIMKRVDELKDSIAVQFNDSSSFLNGFVTVSKVADKNMKESFVSMIDKITMPSYHFVEESQDYSDNSFICDFSQNDLSLIMDSQGAVQNKEISNKRIGKEKPAQNKKQTNYLKKNQRVPTEKTKAKQFGYQTTKLGSPKHNNGFQKKQPKQSQSMIRSKSNYCVGAYSQRQITVKSPKHHNLNQNPHQTQKKLATSRIYEQLERVPQTIINDFLKHDLREVLDLSNCEITDEDAGPMLKTVRKARKIRGLKISQNQISDTGFLGIVEYLNSTSNLNLSYNLLTEEALSIIIENRDKLSPLRIVNLSFNKINEKKAKTKIQALRKMGIIINL